LVDAKVNIKNLGWIQALLKNIRPAQKKLAKVKRSSLFVNDDEEEKRV
jgi:hypothetical protein